MLRDPVDRAYSNWMHLWMDGLEPRADIVEAVRREPERVDKGWAPFWHYQGLGMYGRQVADLLEHVDRERVLLLRYRELVDEPSITLDRVFRFLGVQSAEIDTIPKDNARVFVQDGPRVRALAPVIRAGAAVGQFLPPEVWRRVSKPLISQLHKGGDAARPEAHARAARHAPGAAPARHRAARAGDRRLVRGLEGLPRRRLVREPPPGRRERADASAGPAGRRGYRLTLVTRSCAPSGRATSK